MSAAARRIQALRAKTAANGCTEEEATSAAAKVAELLGAAPQATTDLVPEPVTLPPNLTPAEEAQVLQHLVSLGYELVPNTESRLGGRLHRRFLESDDSINGLKTYLLSRAPMKRLGSTEAGDFMQKLLAGKRICEPEIHPCGFKVSDPAYVVVRPLGAGTHTPTRNRP
jgi:hypothetical protein